MIKTKIEDITRRIWTDINLADKYSLLYGEETITDSILLELAKQHFSEIKIIQTPKKIESIQGTDWEWYIGCAATGWIRFAIQAKKLDAKKFVYRSLNHPVGQKSNQQQIALLRNYANQNGAVPLFHFYNHFPSASQIHWQCCTLAFDKELLGWTFTPLRNVEYAINKRGHRTFDKMHQLKETLPVRCLFSCLSLKTTLLPQEASNSEQEIFLGEPFKRLQKLPEQFEKALETGILKEFPTELYNETALYPKRIAFIEINE